MESAGGAAHRDSHPTEILSAERGSVQLPGSLKTNPPMTSSRRAFLKFSSASLVAVKLSGYFLPEAKAGPVQFHPTDGATSYKCIFNHELLVIVGKKENSSDYIASF